MSATTLSQQLHRVSRLWVLVAAIASYAFFLSTIMPQQAADSAAYAGEWGAPDRHFFYSPTELYAQIADWPEAGRRDYIRFRLSWDIGWALTYTLFLLSATGLALQSAFPEGHRQRRLNLLAPVPGLLDLAENLAGIGLVANADLRLDTLAWLAAGLSSTKWLTLLVAHLLLLYACGAAVATWLRRRRAGRD